jgi:flagellar L-ring protein precursor FlgH
MTIVRKHRKGFVFWSLVLWGGLVIGCGAHTKQVRTPQEPIRPKIASPPPEEPANTGSLWSQDSSMGSLFSDLKARGVGDIVTISIVESSSATESAGTDTSRDSSVNAALNNFLGLENELVKNFRHLDKASLIDATLATEFEGAGKTVRSGQLTASITAKIIEVLPNGNFVIEGRREVEVNHENQYIVISGIIRPEDISPDNIVLSTYISDARITYSGRGVVDDSQRPGWFTGLVNRVWPF